MKKEFEKKKIREKLRRAEDDNRDFTRIVGIRYSN